MNYPHVYRSVVLITLAAFLAACGTNPYSLPKVETAEPSYEEPAPQPPGTTVEPSPEAASPASSAHSGLLASASEARGRGEYDQALAYLERAQRIDPDNAEIYLALAQTHAAAGNGGQASTIAERGLLYCSDRRQCDALRAYTR